MTGSRPDSPVRGRMSVAFSNGNPWREGIAGRERVAHPGHVCWAGSSFTHGWNKAEPPLLTTKIAQKSANETASG